MRLSLHEVLAIVGRLDDNSGFDTPRDRFRRFLVEHMTSAPVARTFLDEAQQLISEQYQRALQDTVLAAGRLLGFEITFGDYERHGAAARTAGQWLSRRRLTVTIQLWSDDASTDFAAVTRALDAPQPDVDPTIPHARLSVVTASCGSRPRIEEAVALRSQMTRIVSLRSLMDLISVANTPHLTHDDVLRLLNPTPSLEGQIGLLARLAHSSRPPTPAPPAATPPREQSCWVYVVREHEPGNLEPVGVSDRLLMTLPAGETPAISAGDLLAFLVPSRGVVAQSRVGDVLEEGADDVGDSQVRYALRLDDIVILNRPAPVETEQRLNLELQAAVSQEPCVRVSRDEFEVLTLAPHAPTV
ncbi:MAG: hypothetical protein ABL986_14610 [Vicinamibacterales bacterium]